MPLRQTRSEVLGERQLACLHCPVGTRAGEGSSSVAKALLYDRHALPLKL